MIVIEPPSRSSSGADLFPGLSKLELSRFLRKGARAARVAGQVTVLLAGDERIRSLNHDFRGKNKATDVLSFPAGEHSGGAAGDLAISVETAARQAMDHGHTLIDELRILMLHGLLHLAGHDHEVDAGEMRTLEAELRIELGLPAGLIERARPAKRVRTRSAATTAPSGRSKPASAKASAKSPSARSAVKAVAAKAVSARRGRSAPC